MFVIGIRSIYIYQAPAWKLVMSQLLHSLLWLCGCAGGQPHRAEQLFEHMYTICKPDASTFNCLVAVYCKVGKSREAQNLLELMVRSGQHVELTTYNALIDATWSSGVVPMQKYALQLFERACKQGLYKLHIGEQVRK